MESHFNCPCIYTHSEEARSNGFTVVVDGDVIHDFLMRPMIKVLATIQVRPHPPVIKTILAKSISLNNLICIHNINSLSLSYSLHLFIDPQAEDRAPFRKVYYVSSNRDLTQVDWSAEFNGHYINLPVNLCVCVCVCIHYNILCAVRAHSQNHAFTQYIIWCQIVISFQC